MVTYLEECAALDPRFKSLSWLPPAERDAVFARVLQLISAEIDDEQKGMEPEGVDESSEMGSDAAKAS
jgi:hypothetical protein